MNIDGQLKTLMDRCYRNKSLEGKEFYYITVCADPDEAYLLGKNHLTHHPHPNTKSMRRNRFRDACFWYIGTS